MNAIQLLISGDAVCPSDAVNIVRVLGIQASSCASSSSTLMQNDEKNDKSSSTLNLPQSVMLGIVNAAAGAVYSTPANDISSKGAMTLSTNRSMKEEEMILVKVLQTLTTVVTSRNLDLTEEVISQSLLVCMAMMWSGSSKDNEKKSKLKHHRQGGQNATKIRKFSIKTLKQVIAIIFERTAENEKEEIQSQSMIATKYVADRVVLDLCILSQKRNVICTTNSNTTKKLSCIGPFSFLNNHTPSSVMKSRCMSPLPPPRSFCLELLDMILSQQPALFFQNNEFMQLLSQNIIPLLKSILYDELLSAIGQQKKQYIDYCLLVRCIMLSCTVVTHGTDYFDILDILCKFIIRSIDYIREYDTFEVRFFLENFDICSCLRRMDLYIIMNYYLLYLLKLLKKQHLLQMFKIIYICNGEHHSLYMHYIPYSNLLLLIISLPMIKIVSVKLLNPYPISIYYQPVINKV